MNKKTTTALIIAMIAGAVVVILNKSKPIKDAIQCINHVITDNNIQTIHAKNKASRIILTGNATKQTKEKINFLLSKKCHDAIYFDEVIIIQDKPKHSAWITFEIDEFNEMISVHGTLKNQQQIESVLMVFAQNYPKFTLKNDIEFNVLIKRKHELADNLSYLLPSIKTIKVAKINLSETTIILEGLIRNSHVETKTITQIKNIFSLELNIIETFAQLMERVKKLQKTPLCVKKIANS